MLLNPCGMHQRVNVRQMMKRDLLRSRSSRCGAPLLSQRQFIVVASMADASSAGGAGDVVELDPLRGERQNVFSGPPLCMASGVGLPLPARCVAPSQRFGRRVSTVVTVGLYPSASETLRAASMLERD
jgi:hypothetical protein